MRLTHPIAIVLDSSPLGLITQKLGNAGGDACRQWFAGLVAMGCRFFVPEIADYETRRELLRIGDLTAVSRLDLLNNDQPDRYVKLTTDAERLACELWALSRQIGRPTADPHALDGDVLITAQARLIVPADYGLSGTAIATANTGHMTTLANLGSLPSIPAERWSDILPHGL